MSSRPVLLRIPARLPLLFAAALLLLVIGDLGPTAGPVSAQVGRWYPTNVTLPDGRILILSGIDEQGELTDLVEVYDSTSGIQVVPGANRFLNLYPWMHVLPSGKVFHAGPEQLVSTFDPATATWQAVAFNSYGNRPDGASVLLPLQTPDYRPKVLALGEGQPATATAEIIDLGEPTPTWNYTASMNHARHHADPVLLPDGKLLIVGGTPVDNDKTQAVLAAESFDPASETWTELASMQRPRTYHSTAILLPDGRVLAAGTDGEFTAEIYSPPYPFQGPRPAISSAPEAVSYGSSFQVPTTNAEEIGKVVLVRPAAMTHSVNMGQRLVELDFQAGPNMLAVQAPPSGNLAPPGYYMLFIVNSAGVPSEATFVRLGETTDGDGDGLSNDDEINTYGTDPLVADTDGDWLSDGDELLLHNTDPLVADTDDDGLSAGDEVLVFQTDPLDSDSDDDSISDGVEINCGASPLRALSRPERLEGVFLDVDDDGDTLIDEALPGSAAGFDCDGDGYPGNEEDRIFSSSVPSTQRDQDA